MRHRKYLGLGLFVLMLAAGIAVLARPATVGPETVSRQEAVWRSSGPAGYNRRSANTEINLDTVVNAPVPGITIRLADIPTGEYFANNEYDRWLRGEIDLGDSEGLISEVEAAALRAEAQAMPPDNDVQQIAGGRAPDLGLTFPSLDIDDCCGGGQLTPPDPDLAVGNDHIVAVVNAAFMVHAQTDGSVVVGPTTFSAFFAALGGGCVSFPFDPNALYDEEAGRYILAADGDGAFYCVGVSVTDDPTGSWHLYAFPTNVGGAFFDYPHIGVGSDAIYVGANMFGGGTGRVWALDKWAMYDGLPAASVTQATGTDDTPQPLKAHGFADGTWPAGGVHYILTHRSGGGQFALYRWIDPFGANLLSVAAVFNMQDYHGVSVGFPVSNQQQGGGAIEANDNRGLDFEWRDGSGWMTSIVSCNPGGGTVNCIQWAEIDLASIAVVQAGVFASSGVYRYFPDLAVNACGDMLVGYTRSSVSEWPSIFAAGRESGDPPGVVGGEVLVKAGEQRFTGYDGVPYRWGDYTGLSVSPDGRTLWYLGEYSKLDVANQSANWGTYVGALTFPNCAPAADFALAATPESLDVCVGDPASFLIDVASYQGFADPVSLSASGVPAGYQASFSVNPVVPPGASDLLLDPTGPALAGQYAIEIQGAAATATHTTTVQLDLFDGLPGPTTLLLPPPGATGVSLVPTFSWNPSPTANAYRLSVATDPGFANIVYTIDTPDTSHTSGIAFDPLSTYYWTVRPLNPCGVGSPAPARAFTTLDVPPILLVDDDDNSPDVRASYVAALDALGLAYDVFDTANSDNEPPEATLMQYDLVIWFTGDEFGGASGPGPAGETALAGFLDAGNCLLISSQDYLYDRGLTAFMGSYLGVGTFNNDVTQTSVSGTGSVFGTIGTTALTYPFTNYSDRILPDGTAETAFVGNQGSAAVNKEAGYRSAFLGFPIEALPEAVRRTVLSTMVDWCQPGPAPLLTLTVRFRLNNGSADLDTVTFYDDGSFLDADGHAGNWGVLTSPLRLQFRYQDGSNCGAYSRGTFQGGGLVQGFRVCTDGSGLLGIWRGTVVSAAPGFLLD